MARKRTPKKSATKSPRKKATRSRAKKPAAAKKSAARKKTSNAASAGGPRNASQENVQLILPEPGEVVVRMYRQGLGDCFLLAFATDQPDKPRYILIDCGVHMRQREGKQRLLQVMRHFAKATDNHIHAVVATHEHADHLSGFVQKNSPFLKKDLSIGQLWVAWTEKVGDPDADRLRKEKATAREIIDKAVKEALSKNNPRLAAFADRLHGLMDFETPQQDPMSDDELDSIVAAIDEIVKDDDDRRGRFEELTTAFVPDGAPLAAAGAKKKKPSSNELALGLLAAKAESVEYFTPGSTVSIEGAGDARAYVLGPPRNDLFLKKDLPSKVRGGHAHEYKETYLSGSVELQALRLAPALGMSGDVDHAADQLHPFVHAHRRGLQGTSSKSSDVWGETMKRVASTSKFFNEHYFEETDDWRAIEGDWLAPAEQLALHLDSDTNNTSLALAFELGEPGAGDVLLFPGDAQVGNWLSWGEQKYRAGGKTVTINDLLKRTLIYKCGHHGSHNATLKNFVRPKSKDDGTPYGLELMNDIITLIPVDRDAADRPMPHPWRMPHSPLYKRLRNKSDRRVLRADESIKPLDDSAANDVVPKSTDWTAVPGKPGLKWRRSIEEFQEGTEGPLYYEIRIPIAKS